MALLLIAAIGLGRAGLWWLAGSVIAAVFVAAPFRGRLTHKVTAFQLVLMGVPVAILGRLIEGPDLIGGAIFWYAGFYLLLVALVRFLAPPSPTRLPHIIFCAAAALAATGGDLAKPLYLGLVAAFSVPALVALRSALPVGPRAGPPPSRGRELRRFAVLGLAFVATGALATVMTVVLDHYYEDLNLAFVKSLRRVALVPSGGFSGKARLGNVPRIQAEAGRSVALRAFAKTAPGYLRGKTFATYARAEWTASGPGVERRPIGLEGDALHRQVLDGRPVPADTASPSLTIKTASAYGAHFFLPLAASAVDTSSDLVVAFPGGTLESRSRATTEGYDVHTDPAPVARGSADDRALPEDPAILAALDGVIARLAPWKTPEEAVASLHAYFLAHYDYELGISFEPGPDPIVQFLTVKDRGHCELFATAGTLLLRRMGVSARYVTGFLCLEATLADDLWLARNKHAHAWTELVGADGAWHTADFTPASGLPGVEAASGVERVLDWLRGLYERVATVLSRQGLVAATLGLLRSGLVWLVSSWWRVALLVALAGFAVARRRRRRAPKVATVDRVFPADVARERESFLRLERSLARKGLGKLESETLPEYAARLEAASFPDREATVELVKRFAARRYAPFAGSSP
jgi:transglutaminase-like putative cysteine protease